MKKLLNYDISLKKILRRAILEKNREMEYIDWLNVVFKINPSDRDTVTIVSLRPKDKTKYNKGTYFKFAKFQLEKALPESILLSDYTNINGFVRKKFKEISDKIMLIFGNANVERGCLVLDKEEVQLQSGTDTDINVRLVRLNAEKKFVNVNQDMRLDNKADLLNGQYFIHVYAGNSHPLFYGERFILIK